MFGIFKTKKRSRQNPDSCLTAAQMRRLMSCRYYLCKDPACRDRGPFDYQTLLVEFDQNQKEEGGWRPYLQDGVNGASQESRFSSLRRYMQDRFQNDRESNAWLPAFSKRSYSLVLPRLRVRYRVPRGLLVFYDEGGEVCSVSEAASIEEFEAFEETVRSFVRNRIEAFIALPEKEKTVALLRQYGIKALFTRKGRSWIPRPNEWVLSENARFAQLNNILLNSVLADAYRYDSKWVLTTLIFFIIGIPLDEAMAAARSKAETAEGEADMSWVKKDPGYDHDRISLLADVCFFAGFANRKTLIRRFYKSNPKSDNTLSLEFRYPFDATHLFFDVAIRKTAEGNYSVGCQANMRSYRYGTGWTNCELLASGCSFAR